VGASNLTSGGKKAAKKGEKGRTITKREEGGRTNEGQSSFPLTLGKRKKKNRRVRGRSPRKGDVNHGKKGIIKENFCRSFNLDRDLRVGPYNLGRQERRRRKEKEEARKGDGGGTIRRDLLTRIADDCRICHWGRGDDGKAREEGGKEKGERGLAARWQAEDLSSYFDPDAKVA